MMDLDVVVIPNRDDEEAKGMDRLEDLDKHRVRCWKAIPLRKAITTRYRTYAHILLYAFPGEERWPRVNKPALSELVDAKGDDVVTISMTSLDYDNVNHEALDEAGYRDLLDRLHQANVAWFPTFIWKTRSGARFLFVHPPLSPSRAEGFHVFLREHYMEHGIPCDPGVWEWNRPHALPWVVRDGAPLDPVQVLEFDPLTEADMPDFPDRPVPLRLNLRTCRALEPTIEEAVDLVWKDHDTSGRLTEWGSWAKNRMRGRPAAEAWDVPSLEAKTRNPTLFKWAGSLVSMLYGLQDTTPEHVFGVLAPTVEANLRPNLFSEVWRAVCYCWAREEAQQQEVKAARRGFMEEFQDKVREWAPEAPQDEDSFVEWVRQRLVVSYDGCYYVMGPSGKYGVQPVKHPILVSALRTSGLVGPDRVIPRLTTLNDKGKETPLRCQDLIDRWSQPVSEVILRGGAEIGGVLIGSSLALTTFARRNDITPEFSDWVDGWFAAWFGEHKPTAEEWFSCALAFEEGPLAALSLESAGGSGKNLIMEALARTTTSKTFSMAKEVIGTFQPKMGKTPFVHVDETWPFARGIHASFRTLIGSWNQSINRKNIHESEIRTCPRILMTANKPNLVEVLFGDPEMTSSEHEATAERVIHLRLGRGGKTYLENNGGMTKISPRLESNEISRHLLWLYHNVKRTKQGRFLMEGDSRDPYLLSLGYKAVAALGEVLIKMFETGKVNSITPISAGMVMEFMDNMVLTDRARGYNLITLGRDLAGFLRKNRTLNLDKLIDFADVAGMECRRVRQAVRQQKRVPT
jgi:hypothetical protein